MRRLILIAFLFILDYQVGVAQTGSSGNNNSPYPSIVPPSPELASLKNIAELNSKNYTGAATVQIPLYEIKAGSLTMPISLNYGTNGVRVNDIPSRVGMGWNLIAGGNISKIVHDEEDDNSATQYLPAPNLYAHNQDLIDYLRFASMENYDTEFDEYSYNVNGLSGKFFLDENGDAQFANKSAIKIEKIPGGFLLTSGDGIKYYFDSETEKTYDVKLNGQLRGNKVKTTGYFLRQIISPEGDFINFVYSPIQMRTYLGSSQSAILRLKWPLYNYTSEPMINCGICVQGPIQHSGSYNQVDYNTYFLSNINTSNGISVNFSYQTRGDESLDNRLIGITVNSLFSRSQYIKKFVLGYNDYPIAGDQQLRYYLSSLSTISNIVDGLTPPETLQHAFYYENPGTLPSQRSFGQDYYGYANGINNNTYFWPKPPAYDNYDGGDLGANREPNFQYSKAGALNKVDFPTGGYQQFVYEPHTLQKENIDSAFSFQNQYTAGIGYDEAQTITKFITMGNSSTQVMVSLTTHPNPGGPVAGQPNYWEAGDGKIITLFKIIRQSDQQVMYLKQHTKDSANINYINNLEYINLPLNATYKITLTVKGSSYRADAQVRYNTTLQTSMVNVIGCGIRVKKILSYDPVSNKQSSKNFTYSTLQGLLDIGIAPPPTCVLTSTAIDPLYLSSGHGNLRTVNSDFYPKATFCETQTSIGRNIVETCTGFIRVSSSTVESNYLFSGSPIAYSNIIESDDPDFKNGGIEHVYNSDYVNGTVTNILEYPIRGHMGFDKELDGKEIKTRIFKRAATNYIVLKEEESIYDADNRVNAIKNNYMTVKRYDPPPKDDWISYDDILNSYDIGGYVLVSGLYHLNATITTSYDEEGLNPLVQRVDYTYDDISHCMPTKITTTNSLNEVTVQTLEYPKDFSADAVSIAMVNSNVITPVIEQSTTVNHSPILSIKNNYSTFVNSNNINFFKPESISYTKGGFSPRIKIKYLLYDQFGNPLNIWKDDGIMSYYIWDYKHSLPTAEIVNAKDGQVAYTSFEAESTGNWTFNPSGIHNDGITGKKAFTGIMTSTATAANSTVTIWAKAEVLVNGSLGALLKTKGLWKLYKWKLSNANLVTVNGVDIDEVRLYPDDAHITTYTYYPQVGIRSICDDNNNISQFEYDGFDRLTVVRDIDNNIVKKNEYVYHSAITPCPSIANWVVTGNTRCVQSQVVGENHNYTGAKEQESKDMNNCSPTYLQSIWTVITPVPANECQSIVCSGTDKRVINGVCEIGEKVLVSSNCDAGPCTCVFIYRWCDGFQSHPFSETNSVSCPNQYTPE